jgi:hypothetical protein
MRVVYNTELDWLWCGIAVSVWFLVPYYGKDTGWLWNSNRFDMGWNRIVTGFDTEWYWIYIRLVLVLIQNGYGLVVE